MKNQIRINHLDYSKLRPPEVTPKKEICSCKNRTALKLMGSILFYNPIHCVDCNLEIKPESLKLNQKVIDEIANWSRLYGAIDHLWLDSGDYKKWAKKELTNIESSVNQLGLSTNKLLNKFHKSYYFYFQDDSVEKYKPLKQCPNCHKKLDEISNDKFTQRYCNKCKIIMFA